jgi:transposase
VLSAIIWVLRTGAPWRDLPERFGPRSTAWTRFRRWAAGGVWQRVFEVLQRDAGHAGRLDWTTHYMDGTVVRAHQHAAGAVSRGGFSTKVHLRAERRGKPLVLALSGGERHESLYVGALLAGGQARRGAPGARAAARLRW